MKEFSDETSEFVFLHKGQIKVTMVTNEIIRMSGNLIFCQQVICILPIVMISSSLQQHTTAGNTVHTTFAVHGYYDTRLFHENEMGP